MFAKRMIDGAACSDSTRRYMPRMRWGLMSADQICPRCSENAKNGLSAGIMQPSAASESGQTVQSWLIGGNADNDLVVDLSTVSGRHCRLATACGAMLGADALGLLGVSVLGGVKLSFSTSDASSELEC